MTVRSGGGDAPRGAVTALGDGPGWPAHFTEGFEHESLRNLRIHGYE